MAKSDLDWKLAAVATFVVVLAFAAALVAGIPAAYGIFGFVLTLVACSPKTGSRSVDFLAFGVLGTSLALFAGASSGEPLVSAIILGLISTIAAWKSASPDSGSVQWSILSLWVVVVLTVGDTQGPFLSAMSFAIGFLLAVGVLIFFGGIGGETTNRPDGEVVAEKWRFAVVKGSTVAVSVLFGFLLFPETPYWVALTVIIVARFAKGATVQLATQRAVGTIFGVGVGVGLIVVLPDSDLWLGITMIVLTFFEMLFRKVDYLLFAVFLTALIVVGAALGGGDFALAGWSRIAATAAGVAMSLFVVFLSGPTQRDSASSGFNAGTS